MTPNSMRDDKNWLHIRRKEEAQANLAVQNNGALLNPKIMISVKSCNFLVNPVKSENEVIGEAVQDILDQTSVEESLPGLDVEDENNAFDGDPVHSAARDLSASKCPSDDAHNANLASDLPAETHSNQPKEEPDIEDDVCHDSMNRQAAVLAGRPFMAIRKNLVNSECSCPECGKTFQEKKFLKKHLLRFHDGEKLRGDTKGVSEEKTDFEDYGTDVEECLKRSTRKNNSKQAEWNDHRYEAVTLPTSKNNTKEALLSGHTYALTMLSCEECDDSFYSEEELKEHVLYLHRHSKNIQEHKMTAAHQTAVFDKTREKDLHNVPRNQEMNTCLSRGQKQRGLVDFNHFDSYEDGAEGLEELVEDSPKTRLSRGENQVGPVEDYYFNDSDSDGVESLEELVEDSPKTRLSRGQNQVGPVEDYYFNDSDSDANCVECPEELIAESPRNRNKQLIGSPKYKNINDGISGMKEYSDEGSSLSTYLKGKCPSQEERSNSNVGDDFIKRLQGKRPFACVLCDNSFKKKSHVIDHIRIHTDERPFECEECDKKFKRKAHLTEHTITHTEERHHYEICGRKFIKKPALVVHTMVNHMKIIIEFACPVCDKRFNEKAHLTEHTRNHTRPYECEICGRKFTTKSLVQKHTALFHAQKIALQCKVCDEKFNEKADLLKHKRGHLDDRSFQCEICGVKFKKKSNLVRHRRQTHPEGIKFKCEMCDKKFKRKAHLAEHTRTHTGERPYQCEICGRKFITKSVLLKHAMRNHTSK